MRIYILLFFLTGFLPASYSQTLPVSRATDWVLAGLRDTTTAGFVMVDMIANGAIGDGITPNDIVLNNVLNNPTGPGMILDFGPGNFLFNNYLLLPDNTVIRGQGPANTTLSLNLNGGWHTIRVEGNANASDTSYLSTQALKDSLSISVNNPSLFSSGDWIHVIDKDSAFITSPWAIGFTGQIIQIDAIVGNQLFLKSPLRRSYPINRLPYIKKIAVRKNVGIECLKIQRLDNAAPNLSSNIYFKYAVNSWISGVESFNCTYSHVEAESSSNLQISSSYFHHGFDYGDGGRAYGVVLHFATGESRVENTVFERLRHSMLLQIGANGNVFAYNYSTDPFWNTSPSNAAGDIVLHGDYPYSNLFEQNICQNIVIDNSHGPNGPFNTFFRNRAESYGIFFSATNSPDQNLIGNEITNLNFPFSLVNYTIQGNGHFLYGNNNKGVITPSGTGTLPDVSYGYASKPGFLPLNQWAGIGTPNSIGTKSIPAKDRFSSGNIFGNSCTSVPVSAAPSDLKNGIPIIFPNPFRDHITIDFNSKSTHGIYVVKIMDLSGQQVSSQTYRDQEKVKIDCSFLSSGFYIIKIESSDFLFQKSLIRP